MPDMQTIMHKINTNHWCIIFIILQLRLNTISISVILPSESNYAMLWHTSSSLFLGFSGGSVVKNLPANSGDTSSTPGLGRSHMPWSNYARAPQPLSLCSRVQKPQLLSPRTLEPLLHNNRATTVRSPRTATRESPYRDEDSAQSKVKK